MIVSSHYTDFDQNFSAWIINVSLFCFNIWCFNPKVQLTKAYWMSFCSLQKNTSHMALLEIQIQRHKQLHKHVWMWLVRCCSLKVSGKVLSIALSSIYFFGLCKLTSKSNEIHGFQGRQRNTAFCVLFWKQMGTQAWSKW